MAPGGAVVTRRPRAVHVAAVVLAAAAAALGLATGPVFGTDVLHVPVVVAVAVAVVLHAGLRRRLDVGARVLVSVAALAVVSAITVVGAPSPAALGTVADGWVNGVARLLSSAVPAPQTPDLVVVPVALAWLVAATGVEAVRSRHPMTVLVPLGLGAVGVVGLGGRPGVEATALVVAAVLLSLVGRGRATEEEPAEVVHQPVPDVGLPSDGDDLARRPRVGRAVAALAATLVLTVLATVVAPSAPVVASRPTWDPREAQELEAETTRQLSPLTTTIGALTLPTPVELFDVETTAPARVRVLSLDHYDGSAWRASGTYVPSNRNLPRPGRLPTTAGGDVAELTVTPTGLRGPFVPVVGQPTRVELDDVRVAPLNGDLVVADGDVSDLGRYALTALLPTPTPDLEGAFRARDDELGDLDRFVDLPALPEDLVALARAIVADADTDYEQLVALRDHFASDDYVLVDPTQFDAATGQQLPTGHSIGRIRDFLGLRESGGRPRVGTVEQYTATFTLMARILGFPARLAVGYREAADGSVVTTARSHAWPEVAMAGHGWTIWDPTPSVDEPGIEPPAPPPADESALPDTPDRDEPVEDPVLPDAPVVARSPFGVVATVVLATLGLLLLALLTRWGVARWRRRRRWSLAPADQRVLLVWHDMVRRLAAAGVAVDDTSTGSEVIRAVRATEWAHEVVPDVGGVGGLATRAAYGREEVDPRVVPGVDASHRRVVRAAGSHTRLRHRVRLALATR